LLLALGALPTLAAILVHRGVAVKAVLIGRAFGFTLLGAVLGAGVIVRAAEPSALQAAAWAATCANCHGTQGRATDAMVPLAGYPAAQMFAALKDFQAGKRPATIMHQLSRGYSDEQLHAVAAYFEAQKK